MLAAAARPNGVRRNLVRLTDDSSEPTVTEPKNSTPQTTAFASSTGGGWAPAWRRRRCSARPGGDSSRDCWSGDEPEAMGLAEPLRLLVRSGSLWRLPKNCEVGPVGGDGVKRGWPFTSSNEIAPRRCWLGRPCPSRIRAQLVSFSQLTSVRFCGDEWEMATGRWQSVRIDRADRGRARRVRFLQRRRGRRDCQDEAPSTERHAEHRQVRARGQSASGRKPAKLLGGATPIPASGPSLEAEAASNQCEVPGRSRDGALTVSARCGSKTRIATVWVVSRPHHGMVLLERERRSGLEAGGPIFAPASALAVDALSSSRVAPASVAHDSSSVRAAIVSIAESQHFTGPNASECNPYSAYWEHRSDCANGGFIDAWCADFAAWVWRHAGVSFVYGWSGTEINAAASSFYVWGRTRTTFTWCRAGISLSRAMSPSTVPSRPSTMLASLLAAQRRIRPWSTATGVVPHRLPTVSRGTSMEPRSGGGAPLAGYVSVPSGKSGGGGTGTGPGGLGGPTGPGTGPGGPSTSSNN